MSALAGLRCEACSAIAISPALACHRCGAGDLTLFDLPPEGAIHATTSIRVPMPERSGEVPAAAPIAVVALDAGPLVVARLSADVADALPAIGTRVRLTLDDRVLQAHVAG